MKKLMAFCCACVGALTPRSKTATDAATGKLIALVIPALLILFQFSYTWPPIQKQQLVTESSQVFKTMSGLGTKRAFQSHPRLSAIQRILVGSPSSAYRQCAALFFRKPTNISAKGFFIALFGEIWNYLYQAMIESHFRHSISILSRMSW
ncbi:MAG: hypothetical protein WBW99_03995 [Pseudolabrys sp.]